MSHRILIADDEPDILEFVKYNLIREGYEAFVAEDGVEALVMAKKHHPHLILLDMMMPRMDGVQTCQAIRNDPDLKNTMVIFLSALNEEDHQIAGFGVGADGYITKPITMKLLMSRIRAIIKRIDNTPIKSATPDLIPIKPLTLNHDRYTVLCNDQEITLPRKEFLLLALLYSEPCRLFSREEIYRKVWGSKVVVGDRTIDVHIRKLRQKIGEHHIETIKGVGYKFEP